MAIKSFNSIAGFSVNDISGNAVIIIDSNGDVSTANITVSNHANLGAVGNVKIYGGLVNQVLTTDGTGNLSWTTQGPGTIIVAAWMPYIINTGEYYIVPDDRQGLFNLPIDLGTGTLEVNGILVEV